MPSVSLTQVEDLVLEQGYTVVAETYDERDRVWPSFCEAIPSNAITDPGFGHIEVSGAGEMQPRERKPGMPYDAATMVTGWKKPVRLRNYGRSFSIPRELLRGQNGSAEASAMVRQKVAEFSRSWATTQDQLVADILQKGTLTAGDLATFDNGYKAGADDNPTLSYDGVPLFDTAHPLAAGPSGSTFANHTVSRALSAANLQTTLTTMKTTNAVDEAGKRIRLRPTHLVYPSALRTTALEILESEKIVDSSNNNVNTMRGSLTPLEFDLLTDDATAWWVIEANRLIRCIGGETPMLRTAVDEATNSVVVYIDAMFGAAPHDWRGGYCNDKAAS